MPTPSASTGLSAIELARAAARREHAGAGVRAPSPLAALEAASHLAHARPAGSGEMESVYQHLLSSEGLIALDALRDAGEALQSAVKLSDLKKRSTLAQLTREGVDSDVAPQDLRTQGAYALGTAVRAAPTPAPADNNAPVELALTLGAMIRKAREQRGVSQHQLADAAGVGRRFVSELENGKSTLEFDKALQVAAAAGISLMARSAS